ncbi:MAG TPA: elongation factor P [Candidatus Saccharimonadales bacterium]|nr:elongation factor P [Candidatus Saccharimonadales bacterium]
MALSITELRKGRIFQLDGVPYKVVDYKQKVMGRGGSIVTVRIKSLLDGRVLEKTFKGNEQLESAEVASRAVQFLYADGGTFYFMDPADFEQFELSAEVVGNAKDFIKEGDLASAQLFRGQVISIELPKNVPLKVFYAEDAVRGDTSSAITKEATLETGLVLKVPAFIKTGDVVSVDTTTGAYRERLKN